MAAPGMPFRSHPRPYPRGSGELTPFVMRLPCLALVLAALATVSGAAAAADGGAPEAPRPAVPVFTISKSENRNVVQYAERLDALCAPAGPAPIFAYWRMAEVGPTQVAPILPREQKAYGLASQVVVQRTANGGAVRMVLAALPSRPVTVRSWRGDDGQCHAVADASIAGAPALLFDVYVRLKWDGVAYLLLEGWSADRSHVVREMLRR